MGSSELWWRELWEDRCWVAVVIRWSFRAVLGGEKAMGWREMKVGSWVRLGKQLGRVWWLEVGLACWKGKREVCCGF